MKYTIFFAALFTTFAACAAQENEYSQYYDRLVQLLEELETIIPEAQPEIAGLIPPVKCQKQSSIARNVQLAIQCLDFFAPRAVAAFPKILPYPKLTLLLNYSGALLIKNKLILSKGVGTIDDVNISYKSVAQILDDVVRDLRATKGTYLDNAYDSVIYFKNLCKREIQPTPN